MRFCVCFAIVLLGLAVAQAIPASKIDTKSVSDDAELDKKNLKIEETGLDKDRSKKSTTTFCVEIRPGSHGTHSSCACKDKHAPGCPHSAQMNVAPAHSANIVHSAPQPAPAQTLNIVQPAPQPAPAQTLNIVQPAHQPAPAQSVNIVQPVHQPAPAQSVNIVQPAPQPAPAQTLNVVQPQPIAQQSHSNIILPASQPAIQPVHTLHFYQPPAQPCAQSAQTVSIVQPAPQPAPTMTVVQPAPQPAPTMTVVQPAPQPAPTMTIVKPEPTPEPTPAPTTTTTTTTPAPAPIPAKIVKPEQPEQPKPVHVYVQEPERIETVNVVPVAPVCKEQVVMVQRPVAAMVQVPSVPQCEHHGLVKCNCRQQNVALLRSPMEAMTIRERPMEALYRNHMVPVMAHKTGRHTLDMM